jgi:hypothetical protein
MKLSKLSICIYIIIKITGNDYCRCWTKSDHRTTTKKQAKYQGIQDSHLPHDTHKTTTKDCYSKLITFKSSNEFKKKTLSRKAVNAANKQMSRGLVKRAEPSKTERPSIPGRSGKPGRLSIVSKPSRSSRPDRSCGPSVVGSPVIPAVSAVSNMAHGSSKLSQPNISGSPSIADSLAIAGSLVMPGVPSFPHTFHGFGRSSESSRHVKSAVVGSLSKSAIVGRPSIVGGPIKSSES